MSNPTEGTCTCDEYDTETVTKIDPDCPCHGDWVESAPDVCTARACLIENLQELRYSGSTHPRIAAAAELDQSEAEFLDLVSEWIIRYGEVVEAAAETHTEMARELVELRNQRKAVRDFLGLPSFSVDLSNTKWTVE